MDFLSGVVGAVVGWFLKTFYPRLETRLKRPFVYSYEFFPLKIASLFKSKIIEAEEDIEYLYNEIKRRENNLNPYVEEKRKNINSFMANLKWLYETECIISIKILNRGKKDLKEISVSFVDFFHKLTGYEFKRGEEHVIEFPQRMFERDEVSSIKTIKNLKPNSPLIIFVWGVVREELKEKFSYEQMKKELDRYIFISCEGNKKAVKKKRIKI